MHDFTSRRRFLKQATMGAVGTALAGNHLLSAAEDGGIPPISLFTKHLQGVEFDKLADIVASIGATGIEAPVRKGGHVEPERVEEDLPKLAAALKKASLELTMITTNIIDLKTEPETEKILRTAKDLGVKCFRMGYYRYDLNKPIWDQVQSWRPQLKELVALCKEIGIQPLYQNHSTKTFFGAAVWDAYELLREYDSKEVSFAFDIMHATIEGSESWPLEYSLIKNQMGAAYFKNFKWNGLKHENCPLAEGVISKDYIPMLKKANFAGPVCLHVEYLKGSIKDEGYLENAIKVSAQDMATLKEWWKAA